ncbi:class I SAM-dependent methyltransferase [Pseudovibrio japonicus]|nr:class I SAM-dependent methyltransferase [Pseudovibrio japonicus]
MLRSFADEDYSMSSSPNSQVYMFGSHEESVQRYHLLNEILLPATADGIAHLAPKPDMQILEIGCGVGDTACYFAQHVVPDGYVTAFDLSPVFIGLAKQQAEEKNIKNISFICADARDIVLKSNAYDLAHTRLVLEHISERDVIVQKVYEWLRPSSCFFCEEQVILHGKTSADHWLNQLVSWRLTLVEVGGGNPNYATAELAEHMKAAGFTEIQSLVSTSHCDPVKVNEINYLGLQREMKQKLIDLGIATEEEIEAMLRAMSKKPPDKSLSTFTMFQTLGRKP